MLTGWSKDSLNTYSADELLQKYINLYNDCVSQIPSDMHVGVHLCRGNVSSLPRSLFPDRERRPLTSTPVRELPPFL